MTNFAGEAPCEPLIIPPSLSWRSPSTVSGPVLLHSALIFWLVEVLRPQMIVGLSFGQPAGIETFQLALHASQKAGLSAATVVVLPGEDGEAGDDAGNEGAVHRVVRGGAGLHRQMPAGSVDLLVIDGTPEPDIVAALNDGWAAALSRRAIILWHAGGASDTGAVVAALGGSPGKVLTLTQGLGLRLAVAGPDAPPAIAALCDAPLPDAAQGFISLLGRLGEGALAQAQASGSRAAEASVRQLQQQLLAGSKRMERVERQLALTQGSLSWRITRPLRTSKAWLAAAARPGLGGRLRARLGAPAEREAGTGAPLASFRPPSPIAAEINILGWPEVEPAGKPVVMGIMDQFTAQSFGPELTLIQPRPDNWYALAEKYRPRFFFIESAWQGNHGSWQYRVAHYTNKPGQEVAEICNYAAAKGIPTIFLNKEDPVHHDKFMVTAKLVSHIFTSDQDMVASYVARTGNRNVHVSPFAAQPALHKPAPLAGRKARICFAGSWYGNRHSERAESMAWLLRAAKPFGLDIFDRNFGTGTFPFPDEFADSVRGSLPYPELCAEYARYRVFLNVNSVINSPTMFSRRVFELLACGTPVVSTWSKGIEELLGTDAVWMVGSAAEAAEAVQTLMTDDAEWRRRSLNGIRTVFSRHTYAHRLNDIFRALGMEDRTSVDPQVRLLGRADDAPSVEALLRFADQQTYPDFTLGIATAAPTRAAGDRVRLVGPDEAEGWLAAGGPATLTGRISAGATYGPDYLRDLANACQYAPDARGWGKAIGRDQFALDRPTAAAAVLTRGGPVPDEVDLLQPLVSPDLYVIDSDQFLPGAQT